jgi:hypothetical protein
LSAKRQKKWISPPNIGISPKKAYFAIAKAFQKHLEYKFYQ